MRELSHCGKNGPIFSGIALSGLDAIGRDPDEAHATAPSALVVAPQGIADHDGRLRLSLQLRECGLKNRRFGLLRAHTLAIRHNPEQATKSRAFAYCFKVAVEVRHHAKPIALAERLEYRPIAGESERHFGQEARSDALAPSTINPTLASPVATARPFGIESGR